MSGSGRGGINIGSVGGNASFNAGGDIVAGDKITTTKSVFQRDDDKRQFLEQIDQLRATLRELQAKISDAPALSQDDKDEIAVAVLQQIKALKQASDEANGLKPGSAAPENAVHAIEAGLTSTGTLLDKVKSVCDKAEQIGEAVGPYVGTAVQVLLTARHLFGLP